MSSLKEKAKIAIAFLLIALVVGIVVVWLSLKIPNETVSYSIAIGLVLLLSVGIGWLTILVLRGLDPKRQDSEDGGASEKGTEAGHTEAEGGSRPGATKTALSALAAVAAIAIALLVSLAGVIWFLTTQTSQPSSEVVLAPVLLIAVVVLVLALGALAIIFSRLGLSNYKAAMGMPEGSIRAVIALMLIVLFFMLSVFMFGQFRQAALTQTKELQQVAATDAAAIPLDQLLEKRKDGGTDTAPTFTVILRVPTDTTLQNFGLQLLTTISTLVVAVASFYFGSSSVTSAMGKLKGADPGQGTPGPGTPGPGQGTPGPGTPGPSQGTPGQGTPGPGPGTPGPGQGTLGPG